MKVLEVIVRKSQTFTITDTVTVPTAKNAFKYAELWTQMDKKMEFWIKEKFIPHVWNDGWFSVFILSNTQIKTKIKLSKTRIDLIHDTFILDHDLVVLSADTKLGVLIIPYPNFIMFNFSLL